MYKYQQIKKYMANLHQMLLRRAAVALQAPNLLAERLLHAAQQLSDHLHMALLGCEMEGDLPILRLRGE